MEIFKTKNFLLSLTAFILINIVLYLFISFFHNSIPLNKDSYEINYHRFYEVPGAVGEEFNFLRSLSVSDAQWYLKIAEKGYPKDLQEDKSADKSIFSGIAYAFFPLHPLLIALANILFRNVELSAFILVNFLMLTNFFSLYFVISKLFDKTIALKAIFLIFLFPFSIFFRSYFAENLYLLLFTWFSYFLLERKYTNSAIFLGLMNITKGNGFVLLPLFGLFLYRDFYQYKIRSNQVIMPLIVAVIPLGLWILFNLVTTGNPKYFFEVQQSWFAYTWGFFPIVHNLSLFFNFFNLDFHKFHNSQIDLIMIVLFLFLLYKSRKFLPERLWWITCIIFVTPLFIKDTISYSRFISVLFPLFIYVAAKLGKVSFATLLGLSAIALFITSLYFVNWYWVG